MTYRPRRLKQAKGPMTAAGWRFFLAPENTVDDYYALSEECKTRPEVADDLLQFYYCPNDWKETWRDHKSEIIAEWTARFPEREKRETHRRWACQSYQDRLRAIFLAERARARIN